MILQEKTQKKHYPYWSQIFVHPRSTLAMSDSS